ncbi:MAG: hypothetical protein V2J42_14025, partial [Wenzhouxiangella sp.]|nr:hypothetical protein [Wenzhouxiangella sp.]
MIPPRLDALFAALSGPAAQERSDRPTGTSGADAWARSLAMVEAAAQPAGSPDRAGLGSDWRAELAELVSGTDQTLGRDGQSANDVVLEFRTLFDSLEGRASQPIPSTTSQPHYDGLYWPSSGELMLLYQGIDPWGGSPGAEQQQWLEQTGPYLGLPPMTDAYQGSVAVGRDFNLIDLAQAAGADPQQAFVDAW